jgi:hypothetical protein
MEEIKEYLKELTDEGIIHPDVRDDKRKVMTELFFLNRL